MKSWLETLLEPIQGGSIFNTVSFMKYTFRKKWFVSCVCGRITNEQKLTTFSVVAWLKINQPNPSLELTFIGTALGPRNALVYAAPGAPAVITKIRSPVPGR